MNREQIETKAWDCETWPDWLHDIVEKTNEVADRLDMSAEQALAYAVLAALSAPKAEAKKNIGTIAHVDHGKTSLTAIVTSLLTARDTEEPCPVCAKPFAEGDKCATDIELGTCHAECLADSPSVDLETGEPVDGPIDTFPHAAPALGAVTAERNHYKNGLQILADTFYKGDQHQDYAKHVLDTVPTSPVPVLTDEAVERAAKGVAERHYRHTDMTWSLINTLERAEWKEVARAALLAAFPSKGEGE